MEIIVEIVLQILGWILQFVGEVIVQAVFQGAADVFGHAVKRPFQRDTSRLPRPMNPWLAVPGYAILGVPRVR